MSTMTTPAATEESKAREAASAGPEPKPLDALHTAYGDTTIADHVVEKIAGIAAREVPGVYAMGSAVGRAYTSMTQRMPGQQQSVSGGVSIEKGERQTAIGVSIVVSPYAVCRASSGLGSGPALAASRALVSSVAAGVVMVLIQTPQDWGNTGRNAVHKSGGHRQTNRHT